MVTTPHAPSPTPDERTVRAALADVADPEIPVVSIVDLGMIGEVHADARRIRVEILPTFVGCPAVEMIRAAVCDRLATLAPGADIDVDVSFAQPWTSDRITARGRQALRESGFGPPVAAARGDGPISLSAPVPCPYCGSRRTVLENAFGPTACRSIRYCTDCRQPFEQFKTV
jgi:ring-1,2-phenylacetyl-CoA epoxidase subunit PaaD